MSLRKAINDMCKSCIYDPTPGNGNWRQQTAACTAKTCPLYPYRPMSKPRDLKSNLALENSQIDSAKEI